MTIKEFRKDKGMSLKDLGKSIGYSLSSCCKYEQGMYKNATKFMDKIKEVYDVELEYIPNQHNALYEKIKALEEENNRLKEALVLYVLTRDSIKRLKNLVEKAEKLCQTKKS